jgi:NAD(P)-dependent dehydrogenase (short-subunit alcohol dehydrogenase family)
MELAGKYALITGAGSGIGEAAALKLAEAGAELALLGRTEDELNQTAARVKRLGCEARVLVADVSKEGQMKAAFETIGDAFGRLDFVFANAGVNGTWAPIEDLSYTDWTKTQAINLGGTFLTLHLAVPLMLGRGGSIALTSSINGTRTFTTPGATAYTVTKAGQVAMVQQLALELGKHAIRVNAVCPGAIDTNISDNTRSRHREETEIPVVWPEGEIPISGGEAGHSADVAEAILFLATERSRHITGTPIWIDGGQGLLR